MGESAPARKALDVARRARLPRVPSSEAADIAGALIADGKDVIILKGAPFWPPPEHVVEAATRAARSNLQPPSSGFPELRRAIAGRLEDQDGISFDPATEILVTAGAMHALDVVFTTLLDPGDEAVIFSPSFFFFGLIELAGAVPVYARTREEDDFGRLQHHADFNVAAMSFTPAELAGAIRKRIPKFEMDYEIDPLRQAIADSWPRSLDDSAARWEWGWSPEYDLDGMVDDMLDKMRNKLQESGWIPDP